MRTANVIGTRVVAGRLGEVVDSLETSIASARRGYVCFANAHLTSAARRDERLAAALADAAMVLADGAPVAWAAHTERIAGADVFEELCRRSPARRYRHFFLGSTDETLALVRDRVATSYPGIEICGTHSPPFGRRLDELAPRLAEIVDRARPDIVWVGLGAPKQELFMQALRPLVRAPLLLGIGAVFDFASGTKRRAPRWMQQAGLEWLYRLGLEPQRLARRYLVTNTAFVLALARERADGSPLRTLRSRDPA
jgi:N-acetylglucosaminyldiphosphoundecaprenol N-acetyl-beta-D-mannosaminyltransferase